MTVLNEIVTILSRGSAPGVLGIEGLPFAGKTTLAKQLAARYDFRMISEHTVFDPTLEQLAVAPWPTEEEAVLKRQREFLRVEVQRSQVASVGEQSVVMDRTIISVIAHLYLRTRRLQNGDGLLGRFLDECANEIDRGNIVVPQSLLFLPAGPKLVLARAQAAIRSGDQRRTEQFLLRRGVLVDLNSFYRKLANRLPGRVCADKAGELAKITKC